MNYNCPNIDCRYYKKNNFIISDGSYFRKNDARLIKRYKCTYCSKRFSSASFSLAKNQKKRRVNFPLFKLLSSGVSQRRAALILNIHPITVKRKLDYLAKKARISQVKLLASFSQMKITHLQLDDLITIEHTKLKPLTVTLAVDVNTRKILAAEVARIPAFGHLAHTSRQKYGFRKSEHKESLERVFRKIHKSVDEHALISSDKHKLYPDFIRRYFSKATHQSFEGGRGCVVGQGELKKLRRDPLFAINHSCAMLRDNISRLVRRTWCTTKLPTELQKHLDLYLHYHNTQLV